MIRARTVSTGFKFAIGSAKAAAVHPVFAMLGVFSGVRAGFETWENADAVDAVAVYFRAVRARQPVSRAQRRQAANALFSRAYRLEQQAQKWRRQAASSDPVGWFLDNLFGNPGPAEWMLSLTDPKALADRGTRRARQLARMATALERED